ncbi:MAG TPA: inositol monophosphatase family protein [Solirubrobacteraceae bacterium]|jgi:myo-inositol-1(or 4)-monophosphatase|nr:inositol monophosphatase family protein [Solirubrobacteraceae bacterium]
MPSGTPDESEELGTLRVIATAGARRAGEVLLERFGAAPRDVRAKSSPQDLVSAADLAAERALRTHLEAARPGDGVLGEEGGETPSHTGLRWVLDPLDGTWNFLHGIPHWCVSVACERGSEGLVGVVYDPLRDECFTAARGCGATLGDVVLDGPAEVGLDGATLGAEFSARTEQDAAAARRLVLALGMTRVYGAGALDMAWLAAGRLHAVYNTRYPSRWDLAAGGVLCGEVGVEIRRAGTDAAPRLLAAAPPLLSRLLAVLAEG